MSPKKTHHFFYAASLLLGATLLLLAGLFIQTTSPESFANLFPSNQQNQLASTFTKKNTDTPAPVISSAQKPLFRIHGSNTLGEKLVPQMIVEYLREKNAQHIELISGETAEEKKVVALINGRQEFIEIHAHGSSTAFIDLHNQTTDIGMSSRPIKAEERTRLMDQAGDLATPNSEHIVGLDGLAIIVDKNNPLQSLNLTQLANIFSGVYTNWTQLGGPDLPIKVLARDEKSGTWDSFKSMVLDQQKTNLIATAVRYESSSLLSEHVANQPGAIGFVGLAYVNKAKLLAIAQDETSIALMPNSLTVGAEDYPLSRRLFMYMSQDLKNQYAVDFLQFCADKNGQSIVEKLGFISQNIKSSAQANFAIYPNNMQQLIAQSHRLSLSFRFKDDSDQLDTKALRDLDRLEKFMRMNYPQRIQLFGFTDDEGDPERNNQLSLRRAKVVEEELLARGITPTLAIGVGNSAPLAANKSAAGRKKNPRVEAWIL